VVGGYLKPYLSKVAKLRRWVRLVDGFAGPGTFEDGTAGSPLIMLDAGQTYAAGIFTADFANKDVAQHQALRAKLDELGAGPHVRAHHGECGEVLRDLGAQLADRQDTVFLYLDPFGVRGADMSNLDALLSRPKLVSTELLINLNTPMIKRLANRRYPADVANLDAVLGGPWWQDLGPDADPRHYVDGYLQRLRDYGFEYTGACPVRAVGGRNPAGTLKYHLAFCSRHPHAAVIMNDVMLNAIDRHAPGSRESEELFQTLDDIVLERVRQVPGTPRSELWLGILRAHFARFKRAEFNASVKQLVAAGRLQFRSRTGRLNDDARLFLPEPASMKAAS
jgi:three-Cys-motif partner protein